MSSPLAIGPLPAGSVPAPRRTLVRCPPPATTERGGGGVAPPQAIDVRLIALAGAAFVRLNLRYWSATAPIVSKQLARWRSRALSIEHRGIRALALDKLRSEGFNAQLAAMLATLAPPALRSRVVEAVVALEVLYDFLDGLTEPPACASPEEGRRLYGAFTDAVAPARPPAGDYYRHGPRGGDGGYLAELVATARSSLAALPAAPAVAQTLSRAAARGVEAQVRIHAAAGGPAGELERWARSQSSGTSLQWQEFLAGAACSVLAVHALVVAAADRRTGREQARAIDRLYLSIAVLPTVLDSVIDQARDAREGRPGFCRLYADGATLAERLAGTIDDVLVRARSGRSGAHHVAIMTGVVAYYLSAPSADSPYARPIAARLRGHLGPLLDPPLALLRAWRAAKRMRALPRARPAARGASPA